MKVYSIGRERGCDIFINDTTDVISRRHATLTVSSTGKMTITDLSSNGTYVNGIRIARDVAVPVTRKDSVSLAQVAPLDWNRIPSTLTPMHYAAMAVVAALIVVGGVWGASHLFAPEPPAVPAVVVDTVNNAREKEEALEKKRKDSLDKVRREADEAARRAGGKKAAKPKAPAKPKAGNAKSAGNPPTPGNEPSAPDYH